LKKKKRVWGRKEKGEKKNVIRSIRRLQLTSLLLPEKKRKKKRIGCINSLSPFSTLFFTQRKVGVRKGGEGKKKENKKKEKEKGGLIVPGIKAIQALRQILLSVEIPAWLGPERKKEEGEEKTKGGEGKEREPP